MKLNLYIKHHHHTYYSLVEPYRENGKNKHRKIYYFGRLSQEELQRIEHALEIMKGREIEAIKIEDIIFENHWRYLDVAFLNFIWKQWGLSEIFLQSKDKDVQTSEIAEMLTIYRCLDPGSYLSAVEWFKKTAIDRILHTDIQHINKSRIFRELDEIENRKRDIEQHLYKTLRDRDKNSLKLVFYDLTDSYFEGRKCELAAPGRTKSNGFRKRRIVLSLLVNSKGYPFAWDVIENYTTDVKTITNLSSQWKMQFKFDDNEIILVFDRGMVSDNNLKHLEVEKYKYITALDKNQITGIENVNIERFDSLSEENTTDYIKNIGFKKYDDATYYEDLGVIGGRRYLLIFNPEMFADERDSREELIQRAKAYMEDENIGLSNAKKSRNESTTRNRIDNQLKRRKASKFVDYDLEPITIKLDGKEIDSFRILPKSTDKIKEAIKKAKRTDGLWAIITNDPGKKDNKKGFTESELISAYRDKNQVEQAFRDVKSFIKIQPFNVWEEKHVRAHYTICVLSYLLDITITNRLREANIDIKSPQKVYKILMDGIIGRITIKNRDDVFLKLMKLRSEQKMILELFQSMSIIEKQYLKSIGIVC